MCSETLWWRCLRRPIADYCRLVHGIEVAHLMPRPKLTPTRQLPGQIFEGQLFYDLPPDPTDSLPGHQASSRIMKCCSARWMSCSGRLLRAGRRDPRRLRFRRSTRQGRLGFCRDRPTKRGALHTLALSRNRRKPTLASRFGQHALLPGAARARIKK